MCRRICLLRATGRAAEAARLQSADLSRALARTGSQAADPAVASRLSALFAAAEERVSDALALAEILGPLLVDQLSSALSALRSASPASAPAFSVATPPVAPPRPIASGPVPGIADFIEEMLARERPSPASSARHAS